LLNKENPQINAASNFVITLQLVGYYRRQQLQYASTELQLPNK